MGDEKEDHLQLQVKEQFFNRTPLLDFFKVPLPRKGLMLQLLAHLVNNFNTSTSSGQRDMDVQSNLSIKIREYNNPLNIDIRKYWFVNWTCFRIINYYQILMITKKNREDDTLV